VSRTRVLIADDERSSARALANSLSSERDIAYVGIADCGQSAYELTFGLEPDVVVVARRLDDGNGIGVTAELKYRFPELRVIVLTEVFDTELVPRAAAARASALLPHDGRLADLLDVIRDDDSDEFVVHPRVLGPYLSNASPMLTRSTIGVSPPKTARPVATVSGWLESLVAMTR